MLIERTVDGDGKSGETRAANTHAYGPTSPGHDAARKAARRERIPHVRPPSILRP